jgi:hypothetical protein
MKKKHIWIYEYKDDYTNVGSTFIDDFIENIDLDEIVLPHLSGDWHWRIQLTMKDEEEE